MELPKPYEYIITIARTNNLKESVHYVTGAKNYEQALSMMSAAGSTLRFCQEENALTEYSIVVHDCTEEEIKYLIHVESDNQGGTLEYVSP